MGRFRSVRHHSPTARLAPRRRAADLGVPAGASRGGCRRLPGVAGGGSSHCSVGAAASGVTTIARAVVASVSPTFTGALLASPALLGVPFLIAGGLKIVYDLLLYRSFRKADIKN